MLKEAVLRWANQIGPKEAIRRLTAKAGPDLSISVADKLVGGRYQSDVSFEKGQAIIKEMAKDGISLAGGKAS